jgi:hypothetical protein
MLSRTVCVVMVFISCAWAGGGLFQRAAVTSMQTTDCVTSHRSVIAALSGTPDTRHELCAEYLLVSPTTVFRVQASKSAPLLLPPEDVNFRAGKGALVLRRDDQQEEFEVKVICMQLRTSKQETCAVVESSLTMTASSPR